MNMSKNTTVSRHIFREYLLGQSFIHIILRLSLILLMIGLIWCALTFLLTLHNQYRKKRQLIQETHPSNPSTKPPVQFTLLVWTRTKERSFPEDQLQTILEQTSSANISPSIVPQLPTYRSRALSTSASTRDQRMNKQRRPSLDLPLVMITDTNSSHTNILELETFEDHCRIMTDLQKELLRQVKASCRTRFST